MRLYLCKYIALSIKNQNKKYTSWPRKFAKLLGFRTENNLDENNENLKKYIWDEKFKLPINSTYYLVIGS